MHTACMTWCQADARQKADVARVCKSINAGERMLMYKWQDYAKCMTAGIEDSTEPI